jgi:hypothetical protein
MIFFKPRDIGMFRNHFDFSDHIFCVNTTKPQVVSFRTRIDLIEFLIPFGVRLDDPNHPLTFTSISEEQYRPVFCGTTYDLKVVQWSLLGWAVEKLT